MLFKEGRLVAHLATSEYRARDGRIGVTHRETGKYTTISVTQARANLRELLAERKALKDEKFSEYSLVEKFLHDMHEVIREAEEQGPPEHDDILRDRVRRRKSQILLPRGF